MTEGEKLAAWRARQRLSQANVATLLGCSRMTVIRMESGKAEVSDRARDAMAGRMATPEPEEVPMSAPVARAKGKPVVDPEAPPKAITEALKREPLFARTAEEARAMRVELHRLALKRDKEANLSCVPLIPLQPEWQTVRPVGRVTGQPMGDPFKVNAAIPSPVGRAPAYGPRAVMTARGAVYDYESAHVMRAAG